jgi:hypothetical protein
MPTQVDVPVAVGSRDDWGLEGAPSKVAAVATHDGDGSFVYCYSGGAQKVQLFTFPPLLGVTSPVTSCTLQVWGSQRDPGVGARYFYLYFNGAQAGSNWGEFFNVLPGYIGDAVYTAAGPTLAQVNGEHGFIGYGSGGPERKWAVGVTYFYRSTTFVYGAGAASDNFSHLLGFVIGAIGGGLLMRDMPALARAVFKRTGTLILPSEYEDALRAWRRERHVAVA